MLRWSQAPPLKGANVFRLFGARAGALVAGPAGCLRSGLFLK